MLSSKISKIYETHDNSRVCQGDILRDLKIPITIDRVTLQVNEFVFSHAVIISQDCDLQQEYDGKLKSDEHFNQFLPNLLLLPAFPADDVRLGIHLKGLYGIAQKKKDSDLWRPIKGNSSPRYHFLQLDQTIGVPELVIDFKTYFTVPRDLLYSIYSETYLATLNELFREDLSQRFAYFLSRIALPELTGS
jgi:hypothetical protein